MLATPLWLAYFGTRWFTGDNPAGFRPLLGSIAALLGTGMPDSLPQDVLAP